ncbi:MAG: glycerophosphodiester phosphodiesterase family protein [Anaerolineales bacterium]
MLDWPRPAVIAHRGASAHAPENTLAAFELALQQGADALEFDVKLTGDGRVVILHDQTVDRTTDGRGDLRTFSLAALRELDAGVRFSERFRGERVPTLEEVFEAFGRRVLMNIELTNYAAPFDALVPSVVTLVRRFGLEKRVLFSSFFPHNLRRAKRLLPEVPCGLLTWAGWMGGWGRTIGFRSRLYQAVHPNLRDVDAGLVRRFQAAGRRVHVWTVNAEADFRRMFAAGVDGVFTDDPPLALHLLGRSG